MVKSSIPLNELTTELKYKLEKNTLILSLSCQKMTGTFIYISLLKFLNDFSLRYFVKIFYCKHLKLHFVQRVTNGIREPLSVTPKQW